MLIAPLFALVACEGIKQGEDLPPQIVTASAEDGALIKLIAGETTTVWVQVFDEDMGSLSYDWSLSLWGSFPEDEIQINPEGSQIQLEVDPDLDGQGLTCTVSDLWNSARIDWTLSVP